MSASEPTRNAAVIRVLVVDDSAFVRKVVREMLSRSPFIEVIGIAHDGEEALRKIEELKPDVVTCDLSMPRLGGVEFVRKQMAKNPLPILILSASPADGEIVLQAMEAGAVDFIRKPSALATDELLNIREQLVEKIKAAARAPVRNLHIAPSVVKQPLTIPRKLKVDAVVLGISTGGPQALRYLIPQLPEDFPVPLLIVLHMPVGYTALFATKLDELSKVAVCEAEEGMVLKPGLVILAQAGRHLTVERNNGRFISAHLTVRPTDKPHCPSVDVLFQSVTEMYKSRVLGVVMTGMGDDGKQGAAWIKAQGGTVITEAEQSCVIYGMPRSVDEAGLSDASVPLTQMAEQIMKHL